MNSFSSNCCHEFRGVGSPSLHQVSHQAAGIDDTGLLWHIICTIKWLSQVKSKHANTHEMRRPPQRRSAAPPAATKHSSTTSSSNGSSQQLTGYPDSGLHSMLLLPCSVCVTPNRKAGVSAYGQCAASGSMMLFGLLCPIQTPPPLPCPGLQGC